MPAQPEHRDFNLGDRSFCLLFADWRDGLAVDSVLGFRNQDLGIKGDGESDDSAVSKCLQGRRLFWK